MNIDRKYQIRAFNPCSGNTHTEQDSLLMLAHDRAVPAALKAYLTECQRLKVSREHIGSILLLIDRVEEFQRTRLKTPDTDLPCEIDRCLNGHGVDAGGEDPERTDGG